VRRPHAEKSSFRAGRTHGGSPLVRLGVLCALLLTATACGGDDDKKSGFLDDAKAGASNPARPGSADDPKNGPKDPNPGSGPASGPGAAPRGSKTPGPWETTEFKDFPYAPLPLARLRTADCLAYTAALADYGNHPSGGMERGDPSIKKEGDECLGWRTRQEDSIRDIKAGHVEYNLGYNCSPMYANLDQVGDRITQDQKEIRDAGPNAVAGPFYRLPEFEKGYAYSLKRQGGSAGSTSVRAVFVKDGSLCSVGLGIKVWAPNDTGKGLKYVGVDDAKAFDELTRILNAMLAG
jgi:hypothetical protein